MAETAIRDYLRSKGLTDEQITYNNGTVYANGNRIMDATPQANGKTYADSNALDSAYNNYDTRNQITALRNQVTQPNQELASMRQALQDRMNKPVQPFSYNQNNDPAYRAALDSARINSQTAAGNIAADMNKKGLLNSTITQDRGNQAAALEYNHVSNEVLPQLRNQAYQQYMGQQQLDNQQLNNMMNAYQMYSNQDQQQYARLAQALGLQNDYNQQQFNNEMAQDQATQQKKQANQAVAQWYAQQYGVNVDPKEDWGLVADQVKGLTPLAMQQYLASRDDAQFARGLQEAGVTGMYNNQPTMQRQGQDFNQGIQKQQVGIQQQNANTSAFSASSSANNAKERLALDKSKLGEGNLGQLTNSLNQTFGSFNEEGKFEGIDSSKAAQLRQAIINMNLPDYQTDQLLASYGLPTN